MPVIIKVYKEIKVSRVLLEKMVHKELKEIKAFKVH